MNINQLQYFKCVYMYRSVSKAAEELHISQPSVSNSIKDLEEEFGVKLFNRFHGGMEPTVHGDTLFALSKDILSKLEQTKHIMSELGRENKIIRLGIPPMIGSLFLPPVLKSMAVVFPDIKLHITESGREELLKKLNDGLVDIAFIPHNENLNLNLCVKHVAKFEIAFCVSEKNKLSEKSTVSAKDLSDVPLVLFDDTFFQTEKIKSWFSVSNVKPDIILQTGQLSTIKSLISKNIASGFLFKEMSVLNDGIKFIPTCSKIYADISLVWKKDSYLCSLMDKFSNFVSKINVFDD
ncbi:MAG: LysR family transcriptional regulator [Clostridia bacterium]|nr:LysR family transcriptional regulator [Clostridia bacterium]